jgi:hypothetical protein
MNFARTNLSILLARQTARAAGRTCPRFAERAMPALPAPSQRPMPTMVPAAAAKASGRTLDQAIEWVGAIAMMAVVLVLALFG